MTNCATCKTEGVSPYSSLVICHSNEPRRRGVALGVRGREGLPDLRLGAKFFVCHNRDAPKTCRAVLLRRRNRAKLWGVARLWVCHTLQGAAANNAIWTNGAVHAADRPLVRERGMRLPSVWGVDDCKLTPICHF
jgi:hypothetical protein